MTDRIFTPLLAFMLLAGGTFAIGSELFRTQHPAGRVAEVATVQLPRVEVTGHRVAAEVATASLPRVEVTGHRGVVSVRLAEPAESTVCTTEEAAAAFGGATATHI